ncbi:MAG: hypothetical protein K1000chlam4_00221 [Chlamydiae bacterium]|nr:hypothetical protein [Chlamydiota bacterium]
MNSFDVNHPIKNYTIDRVSELPEIQCKMIELTHQPTGAEIISIETDDDENLFSLSFRTYPENSRGVAHILEHTVLCGSEKFPVKDPFFGMIRRSLNTFMNALTGADFTCYPASSQVTKDFYNLLDVYLDAVFKPRLLRISFLQEGHRLEFAEPENPSSDLTFKGIVFNEMKGALASGEARLSEALLHALFPDITYGVNSGGDPSVIPELTYEELKAFHSKYYHPSRCLFFFYGNFPLEKHLDFLEEHAFKGIKQVAPLPLVPKQPRFSQRVDQKLSYPITPEEGSKEKTLIGMAWLTCSTLEQEELLALSVLDLALMGTDASPLKMALLKSNLCKQADAFLDGEISEVPFILVCKGCDEESGDALEKVVRDTLEHYAEKGVPAHLVEGAIHQLEFSRTEISGGSSPYGLVLFMHSALLKQHGGKPEDGLLIHTLFKHLRGRVKNPSYLADLIRKHLLDNSHFVRIVMNPDTELTTKENAAEKSLLDSIQAALTEEKKQKIIAETNELLTYQEKEEANLDILPKVTLKDVPKEEREFSLNQEKFENLTLFHHSAFTNDIVYADLIFDLPKIAQKELPYLRLFALLLPQMGCGARDYRAHLDYLLEHTGGIGASLDLCLQVEDPEVMKPMLSIHGKALYRKIDKLFPLFRDLVESADFTDISRLKELLMQHYHSLETGITHHALRYAINLSGSNFSTSSRIHNSWYGLNYFAQLKELVASFEKEPQTLVSQLQHLQKSCLGLQHGQLVLCCSDEIYKTLKKEAFFGLSKIPAKTFTPWKSDYSFPPTTSQGRIISAPVAFTALSFPSVGYLHPDGPALCVASQMMEHKTIHKRVREQGGAYGSGAVNSPQSGQFYFFAYRDPHLSTTLGAFDEAVETIASGQFSASEIEEAKLEIIQDLDTPTSPGGRAMTAYARLRCGRTPQRRQAFRDHLLSVTAEEIVNAVKKHLVPGIKNGVIVSFGGKELLEKENLVLKEKQLPIYTV